MAVQGIPVVITNAGVPTTPAARGVPVTLVGGTAVAIPNGQIITTEVDGASKNVKFTVVNGVITKILTLNPA